VGENRKGGREGWVKKGKDGEKGGSVMANRKANTPGVSHTHALPQALNHNRHAQTCNQAGGISVRLLNPGVWQT